MKKSILPILAALIIGYLLAVLCHLFLVRNVTYKDELYAKYCAGYESSCQCERGNYGIYETGFPLTSGRDDVLPCNVAATTEQRTLNNFTRNNNVAFMLNVLFWSGVMVAVESGYSVIGKRRS